MADQFAFARKRHIRHGSSALSPQKNIAIIISARQKHQAIFGAQGCEPRARRKNLLVCSVSHNSRVHYRAARGPRHEFGVKSVGQIYTLTEGEAIANHQHPARGICIKIGGPPHAMLISLDSPWLAVCVESLEVQIRQNGPSERHVWLEKLGSPRNSGSVDVSQSLSKQEGQEERNTDDERLLHFEFNTAARSRRLPRSSPKEPSKCFAPDVSTSVGHARAAASPRRSEETPDKRTRKRSPGT